MVYTSKQPVFLAGCQHLHVMRILVMELFLRRSKKKKKTPNTFIFVSEGKCINLQHRKLELAGKGGTACRNHSHIVNKYTRVKTELWVLFAHIDVFHNGGLLIYSFVCIKISLFDLVSMCKVQTNCYFQTRSERLIIIIIKRKCRH